MHQLKAVHELTNVYYYIGPKKLELDWDRIQYSINLLSVTRAAGIFNLFLNFWQITHSLDQ